LGHSVECWQ